MSGSKLQMKKKKKKTLIRGIYKVSRWTMLRLCMFLIQNHMDLLEKACERERERERCVYDMQVG